MIDPATAGIDSLVATLDGAVAAPTVELITEEVRKGLSELIGAGALRLPPEVTAPAPDAYARRLIHRSPAHGYTAVVMVWGPGQGTPVHDHAGVWCVEGVVEGDIEVVQYDLEEQDGDRFRFAPEKAVLAGVGSTGSLIPPFEYHTIANACSDGGKAVTLHVYGAELTECSIFQPSGGSGWYRKERRQLGYTD